MLRKLEASPAEAAEAAAAAADDACAAAALTTGIGVGTTKGTGVGTGAPETAAELAAACRRARPATSYTLDDLSAVCYQISSAREAVSCVLAASMHFRAAAQFRCRWPSSAAWHDKTRRIFTAVAPCSSDWAVQAPSASKATARQASTSVFMLVCR